MPLRTGDGWVLDIISTINFLPRPYVAMKNQELKELEAKEVQLRVQVDKARSLISSWMGGSDSEEEENVPTVAVKGAGLGSTAKVQVQQTSLAMAKLKRKKEFKKPRPAVIASTGSDSEEESKSKRSKRVTAKSAFDTYKKRK